MRSKALDKDWGTLLLFASSRRQLGEAYWRAMISAHAQWTC